MSERWFPSNPEVRSSGWSGAEADIEPTRVAESRMRLVVVESPYAGDWALNERYARAALRDCLRRGEAPFASHLLYTQPGVLDDSDPAERAMGMRAGFTWGDAAEATVVYTDLGMSPGMREGIRCAESAGRPVEYRALTAEWWS